MTRTLSKLTTRLGLGGRLRRASVGSIGVKLVGTLVLFAYGLLLARLLSPADYGIYEYIVAWLGLLTIPAVLGLDRLLTREVASSAQVGAWSEVKGLVRWSVFVVLILSLAIAVAAGLIAWFASDGVFTPTLVAFWIGCAFLPITALTMVQGGIMLGLQHVLVGQVPILIVRPLVASMLLGAAAIVTSERPSALIAVGLFVIAAFVSLAVSSLLLRKRMPTAIREAQSTYFAKAWSASALPLMLIGGLNIVNTRVGTVILGSLGNPTDAGIYAVVTRGADLVAFTLVAVNAALAPTFASLYAARDTVGLQRIVTRTTRLVMATALPIAFGMLLFGHWFLHLYGDSFLSGRISLSLLVVGQMLGNVLMGSVGTLLTMTGHERSVVWGYSAAVPLNVIFTLLLAPSFGLLGASVGMVVSVVVLNVILTYFVFKKLGLFATVFGPPGRQR